MSRIFISRGPGGLPGIDAHVGAWLAFSELGITPTAVAGCSAGAIVSALQAAGESARDISMVVNALDDKDVIRKRALWKLRALWIETMCVPDPVRDLLADWLPETFDDLQLPLSVSATRMESYGEFPETIRAGDLRAAVRASMSIHGIWPPVRLGEWYYTDGGTTDAIVLPPDLDEWDAIFVLNILDREPAKIRDRNMVSRLWWSARKGAEYEEANTHHELQNRDNVHWLDLDVSGSSMLHFEHMLTVEAWSKTRTWLLENKHQCEAFV